MRLLVAMTAPSPEQLTDYVIVTLCPDSGLRRGEVIGANLADLDFGRKWIKARGKGREQCRVPFSLIRPRPLPRFAPRRRYVGFAVGQAQRTRQPHAGHANESITSM